MKILLSKDTWFPYVFISGRHYLQFPNITCHPPCHLCSTPISVLKTFRESSVTQTHSPVVMSATTLLMPVAAMPQTAMRPPSIVVVSHQNRVGGGVGGSEELSLFHQVRRLIIIATSNVKIRVRATVQLPPLDAPFFQPAHSVLLIWKIMHSTHLHSTRLGKIFVSNPKSGTKSDAIRHLYCAP